MRRPVLGLCLAVMLTLAGCGAFGGSTGTPTPTGSEVPGIEGGELTEPRTLLSAHSEGLLRSGFENDYRANRTIVRDGQVVTVVGRQRTVVAANRTSYQFRVTSGAGEPTSRFDTWGNRSLSVVRGQVGDTVRYSTGPPAGPAQLTGTGALENHLLASSFRVVGTDSADGRYLVTLEATDTNASRILPANGTDLTEYEARAVVDREGRILVFDASGRYTVVDGQNRAQGVLDVRYEIINLEDRTVSRPEWVRQALAN